MKNKVHGCPRIITIIFIGIAVLVSFNIAAKDIKNIKYYDMDAKAAIAECTDFENARMSFERTRYSPEGELQARDITYSFLCGIQQAETLEVKADIVQIVDFDKNFGDAKIIFEHQTEEKIYSFELVEGENKCALQKGVYNIYIIGKYFSGKLKFVISNEINSNQEQVTTYSFYGENEYFAVSEGSIILSDTESVFDGGKLEVIKSDLFADIDSYSATYYIVLKNGERKEFSSASATDVTADNIRICRGFGRISSNGVNLKNNLKSIEDGLFFELKTMNTSGNENVYTLQLNVIEN